MRILAVALLVLLPSLRTARAETDPTSAPLAALGEAIAALGSPAAGEVESERVVLAAAFAELTRAAASLRALRASLAEEERTLDRLARERDALMARLDREQGITEEEWAAHDLRWSAYQKEKAEYEQARHEVEAREDATREEISRIHAWKERGDAQLEALRQERRRLESSRASIAERRGQIATDLIGHASRSRWIERHRLRSDRETLSLLDAIRDAHARALALAQIADAPRRAIDYRPPTSIAAEVMKGVTSAIAREGALKGLEGKVMMKVLGRVGLASQPIGAVYTVADTFADVATVGLDQRTDEVTKNLFLIGDYGLVMQRSVRARGGAALQDPAYVAMQAEVKRLADEMPAHEGSLLLQGLASAAALGDALRGAAASYLGGRVGRAALSRTNRLHQRQRSALGQAGVRRLRQAIELALTPATEATTKAAADRAASQQSAADDARGSR